METDNLHPCHQTKIPLWLVILDNLPTLILFILGAWIIQYLSWIVALVYIIYAAASIVYFWAMICPWCHHHGTQACPCGYGVISAKFFGKRNDKSFKKIFRKNILVMFPNWFVPLIAAVYLLYTESTTTMIVLTIAFCVNGFLIIPLISRFVGCKNCEIKEDCPWMKINNNIRKASAPILVLIVALLIACGNTVTSKVQDADTALSTHQNAQPKVSKGYSGEYRPIGDNTCDITINIQDKDGAYTYLIKSFGKEFSGKVIVEQEDSETYLVFDGIIEGNKPKSISGLYTNDTLTIQNYGNSMNEYNYFKKCDLKFLEFKR